MIVEGKKTEEFDKCAVLFGSYPSGKMTGTVSLSSKPFPTVSTSSYASTSTISSANSGLSLRIWRQEERQLLSDILQSSGSVHSQGLSDIVLHLGSLETAHVTTWLRQTRFSTVLECNNQYYYYKICLTNSGVWKSESTLKIISITLKPSG